MWRLQPGDAGGRNTAMWGGADEAGSSMTAQGVGGGEGNVTQDGAPELKQTGRFNEQVPERK